MVNNYEICVNSKKLYNNWLGFVEKNRDEKIINSIALLIGVGPS